VRIAALLRRSGESTAFEAEGLRLDPVAHVAHAGPERVPLTPTEFRILAKLVANRGATVRRRELVSTAWPHGARVRDNTLDAYVARLRRKLSPYDVPRITTVQGVGYLLE
jgi:two-component system response regulator MprA